HPIGTELLRCSSARRGQIRSDDEGDSHGPRRTGRFLVASGFLAQYGRWAMTNNIGYCNPRIFYGWLVVAAALAVPFVGFGSAYPFSAFVGSLEQEFAASRGSVSLVFSLAGFLYFALGVLSGPLADRWGSRRFAIGGMVLIGLGLALASAARSLA